MFNSADMVSMENEAKAQASPSTDIIDVREMTERLENIGDTAVANGGGNGRLMSIREVSDLTGVPSHTLRFWEKQMPDILRPERTPGGQRRYSARMVELARMIKRLSDEKKRSLASIRDHLAAANGFEEPAAGTPRSKVAEQMVDLIVDEVASMLKGRLLTLFEAAESIEGGNGFGLDKHKE